MLSQGNLSFEDVAEIYNEIRPGYPKELYNIISKYKNLNSFSNILEIGAGNGVATKEIINAYQSRVTAIEPGKQLCNFISELTIEDGNIAILNMAYEDFNTEFKFDAIFSATAFHWIDKNVKYVKTYNEIKNDGLLVLYWNNYSINDHLFNDRIQKLYNKHSISEMQNRSIYEIQAEKIENRKNELLNSKLFVLIDSGVILKAYTFTSISYIKLLKSFSAHSTKDESRMSKFYEEVKELIIQNNDTIKIDVLVNYLISSKNLTTAST